MLREVSCSFTALVLAADRGSADPVAQAANVPCKAFAEVRGRAMVLRVLDALHDSRAVQQRMLCGPAWPMVERQAELHGLLSAGQIGWHEPRNTPSTSAAAAMAAMPEATPLLLTTADHALLSGEMVDYFCAQAEASGYDLAVALARHDRVAAAYPAMRRTAIQLSDGPYCGCNLFAFMTARSRTIVDFWRRVENERKQPWRLVAGVLGYLAIVRYLTTGLALDDALRRASQRLGLKIGAVIMPFPHAAIDVDKVEDWYLVNQIAG